MPRDKLAAVPGAIQANPSSIVDVRERIMAGYIQADFATDDDRFSGNVGLRVVNTREIANGFAPNLSGLIIQVETGGTVTVPPAGAIAARNSYTNWLPFANFKFAPNDNWVFRAAFSRTMSRPSLTQISPSTTITGGGGNYTMTSGNPALQPFVSTNYDATVEWYPNRDTTLTVALFAKKLGTLVRPTTDSVVLQPTFFTASTNTSVTRDQVFQRTRPTNEKGVTLKGFELGFQATNVLDNVDKTRTTLGNFPADYFDVGRQILVCACFRF